MKEETVDTEHFLSFKKSHTQCTAMEKLTRSCDTFLTSLPCCFSHVALMCKTLKNEVIVKLFIEICLTFILNYAQFTV